MTSTEELIDNLNREKWIIETTDEMARRVGIPHSIGRVILSIARVTCRKQGLPLDMILVANAIKYAGDNKEYLK